MKKIIFFFIFSFGFLTVSGQYRKDTEPGSPGFRIYTTTNEVFTLWLDGYFHLDGSIFYLYYEDYVPIPNGGAVRNARLGLKTEITDNWVGVLEVDFSNLKPRITEAYITYNGIKNLQIEAGHFETLFSMEGAVLPREQAFLEKPMTISALVPIDLLGVQLRTNQYWFMGTLGASFDKIRRHGMDTLTTSLDARAITAKAVAMPFVNRNDLGLHIGVAASWRFAVKDPVLGTYPSARYNSRNVSYINRHKYLDTYVIPNVRSQYLFNGEFAAYYKRWRFQAEYIHNMTNLANPLSGTAGPVSVLHFNGWYVQTGILLLGGKQRYDTGRGMFMNPSRGRKWGDLELLARYDYLNLNCDPIKGGEAQNYTAGLTYYVNDHVKYMINYIYTDNDRYANGNGQYLIGHDAGGYPTADYSLIVEPAKQAGVDYHSVSLRLELTF
ncbi:MAG: porin [Bacteroidales bacterium]|jgi:phosphate-selective porin OprO/OprP|nr:OprO/OprP family phosphate-selective porin [Bacteroidales bacterium]MDD2263560.1 porin [Bacteroidales bacterium]MDD2830649.1 porin [Bacteroidales bacterium]MDD3207848.1 porin [Bacteroidales bacterium]MDD3696644.1 porin [Bacteroidales bacterium]